MLAGCASAPAPADEPPTVGLGSLDAWFGPDEILRVLDDSEFSYAIIEDPEVRPTPLHAFEDAAGSDRPLDPFLVVHRGDDGAPRLESRTPPPEIVQAFEEGAIAFSTGRYDVAVTRFQRCVDRRPDYFKGHTYLGRTWLFLDDAEQARAELERALELNPLDYQAHMFLADTYARQDRWREAKAALTRAWTLNPGSEPIRERLRSVLGHLDLRLRRRRLDPAVAIRFVEDAVEIAFSGERSARWLPLAACLACWRYELRCSARAPGTEDPLQLTMYRECLLNQVATVAVREEHGQPIGADERALFDAVHAGLLEAMVLWEIVARSTPVMMLLVDDGLRREVEVYVDRFVFASTRRF